MRSIEWQPEYDSLLEQIASTDVIDAEWTRLRELIKFKLEKNIDYYLANPPEDDTAAIQEASRGPSRTLQSGGLKVPPFAPRIRLEGNPNEAPKHLLTTAEANDFKDVVFKQLDEFDGPPFTIQRVCELCLSPQKHYKFLGKYLRAVEKALLVTSTWDAFPIAPATDGKQLISAPITMNSTSQSTPSTPMFSPIPFLHGDARSHSRSPPPSPLALTAIGAGGSATTAPHKGVETGDQKVLGLVDELDDPSPGHLSDHLQPLSSTTTVTSKPLIGSLQERFVASSVETQGANEQTTATSEGENSGTADDMAVDEESEDKENKVG